MKRQRNVALQCTRASEGLSLQCPIESAGIRDQVSPFYSCSQWGGLGPLHSVMASYTCNAQLGCAAAFSLWSKSDDRSCLRGSSDSALCRCLGMGPRGYQAGISWFHRRVLAILNPLSAHVLLNLFPGRSCAGMQRCSQKPISKP